MSDEFDIRNIKWRDMNKNKLMFYGIFAQLGLRLSVHPLNVMQTNMQANKGTLKLLPTFQKIYRTEGIYGLYKGFGVHLLSLPAGQIYIVAMEYFSDKFLHLTGIEPLSRAMGGGIGSSLSGLYAVPVDIISQRRIMTGHKSMDIAKELYKLEGIKGFYRGYIATLLISMPSSTLFWGLYSVISKLLVKNRGSKEISKQEHISDISKLVFSALISVYITTTINNPLSVIRTRIQVISESKGILKEAVLLPILLPDYFKVLL